MRIFIVLLAYLMGSLHLSDVKIWKFTSTTRHGSHHNSTEHSHLKLNNKPGITYDPSALRDIETKVHHDQWVRILHFGAIKMIRSLGLNVKPRSCRYKRRIGFKQYGIEKANLIRVKRASYHDPNIILATLNIQSLKTKELEVSDLFDNHAIDTCTHLDGNLAY